MDTTEHPLGQDDPTSLIPEPEDLTVPAEEEMSQREVVKTGVGCPSACCEYSLLLLANEQNCFGLWQGII